MSRSLPVGSGPRLYCPALRHVLQYKYRTITIGHRTRAEYVFFIQIASLRFAVIPANVLLKLSIIEISITKTAHTANLALSSGIVSEPRAAIKDRVRSCGRKSSASSRFKGARENNLGGNYPHIPSGCGPGQNVGGGGRGLIAIAPTLFLLWMIRFNKWLREILRSIMHGYIIIIIYLM